MFLEKIEGEKDLGVIVIVTMLKIISKLKNSQSGKYRTGEDEKNVSIFNIKIFKIIFGICDICVE